MDIDRSDRRNHGIHLEYLTLDSLIKGSSVALMDDCIRLFRIKIIRPFQKKKKEKFAAKKCATYPTKKKTFLLHMIIIPILNHWYLFHQSFPFHYLLFRKCQVFGWNRLVQYIYIHVYYIIMGRLMGRRWKSIFETRKE